MWMLVRLLVVIGGDERRYSINCIKCMLFVVAVVALVEHCNVGYS